MSYTPSVSPKQQPKDNRNTIYGILVLALIASWGYILYDKRNAKEIITQKEGQIVSATTAKDSIQNEFNMATARLDSLVGVNTQIQGALASKNEEILAAKASIKSILNKADVSKAELAKAKKMIADLNGKIDGYIAEIEKLKGENKELTVQNTQLSADKAQLANEKEKVEQNLSATEAAKKNVEDIASTLHASNIAIAAVDVKSNGKQKETTTAKKADLLRFSFDLDENRIAPTGVKTLYICVVGPDGNPLTKGGTLNTRESGEKAYTNKLDINYEQGKKIPVSFDYKQEGAKFVTGNYKVEIYNNGFKIGEATKTLKKSSFLGL